MRERSIFELDWDQADFRNGAMAVAAIVVVALIVLVFGVLGVTVGLAALFVLVSDVPAPVSRRVGSVLGFTIVGSALAYGGAWAGSDRLLAAAILMTAVVYLATVAAALGKPAAVRGLLMAVWLVLALSLSGSVESPTLLATSFLTGGLVASVAIAVRAFTTAKTEDSGDSLPVMSTLMAQIVEPLGRYALIRGLAAGIATIIGGLLFADFPIWVTITVLVILREDRQATYQVGVLRTMGTLLGVIVATAFLGLSGESGTLVLVGSLMAGFAMFALKNVNYALFTLFLTVMLVLVLHVQGDDPLNAGVVRILETVIGAGLAFGAMRLARLTRLVQA